MDLMDKLAIEGGQPVRDRFLPCGQQWLNEADIAAVTEVLKGDWLTQGPKVAEFEHKVAEYCGARYAVAVSSGSAALEAACAAAGIGRRDEVITTPLTFAATANAIVHNQGKPVFADIRPDTLNIDTDEIRRHLSPVTRAIIPVHFAGHPADMDGIMALAMVRGLTVIDDACQALGAEYKGRRIGDIADMTVLSFHPVKHITSGEGGMVLTDSRDFYQRLRIIRHHGITRVRRGTEGSWYYQIDKPGYNFRLSDIQCALGSSQMDKLEDFLMRRRQIVSRYNQAFASVPEVITPFEAEDVKPAWLLYIVQLNTRRLTAGRKEVYEALKAENIGVQVHYVPLHLQPFYQASYGYKEGDFPVAENYYQKAITLPLFPKMSDDDVEDVIKAVKKVIRYYRKDH